MNFLGINEMNDYLEQSANQFNVKIRPGRKSDCKEIIRLVQELADFEKMPYGPKIDASVLEHDGFVVHPPLYRTFVAELEDDKGQPNPELIGYALYYNKYSTWKGKAMFLEDLYVTEEYRKRKIGSALLRAVVKEAVLTGCQTLDLDVLAWNPARKFYEAHGGIDITESESWHFYRWTKPALEVGNADICIQVAAVLIEMIENGAGVESWFHSLADEALARNYKSECTWTKYKDDLEETKKILSWLPVKLKHDVMVPIGRKALMRGKMVHTNELLVNLGETWFVKRSASQAVDVCKRRIQECDQMLEKLKKERELLENKKSLPSEKEAFGSEERPEIIEYVSEEEHQEWKKQHRIKEREYRQKLAQLNNKRKKPIQTEEDLWNHLDELELREELEDELNRLNAAAHDNDDDSDDDDDDDDYNYYNNNEEEENEKDENEVVESKREKETVNKLTKHFEHDPAGNIPCTVPNESNVSKSDDDDDDDYNYYNNNEEEENEKDENEVVESKREKETVNKLTKHFEHDPAGNIPCTVPNESNVSKNNDEVDENNPIRSRKLSVSFAVDIDNSSDYEPLILKIKHSSVEPVVSPFQGVINSPGDIYQAYLKTLNPKSILKCSVNINQEKEFEAIKNENQGEVECNFSPGIVLPDVFAKNTSGSGSDIEVRDRVGSYKEPPKRISKFKASRMKKS